MSFASSKKFPDRLAGLSDLFFNYEHPSYDSIASSRGDDIEALHNENPDLDRDIRDALISDAADFIQTLVSAVNGVGVIGPIPASDEFADDFLARL